MTLRMKNGSETVYTSDADCIDLPIAVLIDDQSISAAEFFAAALQEYDRATLVGTHTTGKGRAQRTYQLRDGSAVNLSVEEYFTPKGKSLADVGIAPDIDDVYDITPNEKNGYQAMAYFSQLETPPSAFYCANDILAIGMLKYLAQSKNWYYHPSVISSDNIVESQYTTPMLTTVSLPKAEMAHLAIQILTDRMNGGHKAVVKTELQSTLVIRQSVHQYVSTENEPEYYI